MSEGRVVFEANADEKARLTVEGLMRRSHVTSDRMLLS